MDNQKICNMVRDLKRLIVYQGNGQIEVDVSQFPESFAVQHFSNNPEVFADEFVKKLEQTVFKTLSGIQITDYTLVFTFKYYGMFTMRTVKYYMLSNKV